MGFTAVAIAGGLLLGLVAGGRPSNLVRRPLRWWPALTGGVLLQSVVEIVDVDDTVGVAMVCASYALLTAFAARNLRLVGMPVALLGLVLNMAVIGINGGMPVREEAVRAAGDLTPDEVASIDFGAKRHLEDESDRLVLLGDVIPVRPTREVLSFGDLLLAFGTADVLFRLLRPVGATRAALRRGGTGDKAVPVGPAG